jgi:Probable Zinc-ribbon domain
VPPLRALVSHHRQQSPLSRSRWTLDDYRDAFHLPMGTPTVSRGVSASLAAEAHRRRGTGELRTGWSPDMGAGAAAVDRYRVPRWRSLAALRPELAAELHRTRNGDLDPYALAPTSSRRVWWRCPRCGHEWQTPVGARARGDGCRECAKRAQIGRRVRVRPGQSLAELRPDLAAELHPIRNGDLDPDAVVGGAGLVALRQLRPRVGAEPEEPDGVSVVRRPPGAPRAVARRPAPRSRRRAAPEPQRGRGSVRDRRDLVAEAVVALQGLRPRVEGVGAGALAGRRRLPKLPAPPGPPAPVACRPALRSCLPAAPHPQRRPRPLRSRPPLPSRRLVAVSQLRMGVASVDTGPCWLSGSVRPLRAPRRRISEPRVIARIRSRPQGGVLAARSDRVRT